MRNKVYLTRKTVRLSFVVLITLFLLWPTVGSVWTQDAAKKPIRKEGVINALRELRRGDSQALIVKQIRQRGVDFELTPAIEKDLRAAGASTEMIEAIRANYRRPPPPPIPTPTRVPSPQPTASSTPVPRVDTESLARQATQLLNKGDYDGTIRVTSEAIAYDSTYGVAYLLRGGAYLAKHDYYQAIKDFNEVIRLNSSLASPDNVSLSASAYMGRGAVYENTSKYDLAIKDFTESIRLNPKSAVSYKGRGVTYLDQRDYDQGIKDLTEAIQLDPQFTEAYFLRGEAYANKGNLDQVSKNYANITISAGDPDSFDILFYKYSQNKRFVLINDPHQKYASYPHEKYAVVIDFGPNTTAYLNEYDQAIKDYTAAIEHGLDNSRAGVAYKRRGDIYLIKGGGDSYNQAFKDYTRAIQLEPKSAAAAYIGRGIVHLRNVGENRAIRDALGKPLGSTGGAQIVVEVGLVKAIEDCTAAIQLDPKSQWAVAAYIIRGGIHFFKYDLEQAIKDYTEAIGLEQNPNTYNARAQAYYRKGDYGQAVKDFTEAIRLDQQNASRYFDRARAYEKLKKSDLAAADKKKGNELLRLKKE